jgi:F-box protein, helicase, 18
VDNDISVKGEGGRNEIKTRAVLARTNLSLLLKAINLVIEERKVKSVYFEGNFNSYTYAEDGASLYDVLNLYKGRKYKIRDKLISKMRDFRDLEEYIEKTGDTQLGMLADIVREYDDQIPSILEEIKRKHTEKDKAEMIFSTMHKSKGMEYDEVQLAEDFITSEKVIETVKKDPSRKNALNEEINLLYVAVTRTRNKLIIPAVYIPKDFKKSENIIIEHSATQEKVTEEQIKHVNGKMAAEPFAEIRSTHKDAYKPWTDDLDCELTEMYCEGRMVEELAIYFGRTKGAIYSRIKKLELEEKYG